MVFGLGMVYCWIQAIISHKMRRQAMSSALSCYTRFALSFLVTVFFIISILSFNAMLFYWVEQGVVLDNKINVQEGRLICVNQVQRDQKSDDKPKQKLLLNAQCPELKNRQLSFRKRHVQLLSCIAKVLVNFDHFFLRVQMMVYFKCNFLSVSLLKSFFLNNNFLKKLLRRSISSTFS